MATYYHDGIPYAIIGNKMGYFWIIDLNEMKVKLSKKVSPWGMMGGSSPFSMAVDQQHMIAIYTARGPLTGSWPYVEFDVTSNMFHCSCWNSTRKLLNMQHGTCSKVISNPQPDEY